MLYFYVFFKIWIKLKKKEPTRLIHSLDGNSTQLSLSCGPATVLHQVRAPSGHLDPWSPWTRGVPGSMESLGPPSPWVHGVRPCVEALAVHISAVSRISFSVALQILCHSLCVCFAAPWIDPVSPPQAEVQPLSKATMSALSVNGSTDWYIFVNNSSKIMYLSSFAYLLCKKKSDFLKGSF